MLPEEISSNPASPDLAWCFICKDHMQDFRGFLVTGVVAPPAQDLHRKTSGSFSESNPGEPRRVIAMCHAFGLRGGIAGRLHLINFPSQACFP
ncbi:hypothetical protein NQZ68_023112 [Dissostichus eleginoides]|nr:hypothetical protein NQZ68_023112 [Dissostichus eleginoides]